MEHQVRQQTVAAPPVANWPTALWGVIARPGATFAALADARPWRQGLVLSLLTALASGLVDLARPTMATASRPAVAAFVDAPLTRIAGPLLLGPLVVVAAAGLLYQVGLRQGGTGPFTRLLTTELFKAVAVGLLTLPLLLALNLGLRAELGVGALVNAVTVARGLWGVALTVASLRASLRLGTGGAVATLALGLLVALVGGGLASCVLVVALRALL